MPNLLKLKMKEIWKNIDGYEGLYKISNKGRVKSMNHKRWNGKCFRAIKEKILTPQISGYLHVRLYLDGIAKIYRVHKLVAKHFIPNPNNLPCVLHGPDDDKQNNYSNNLRWGTQQDNMNDRSKRNRQAKGENINTSTLIESDVIEIKRLLMMGFTLLYLSEIFEVTQKTISNIKLNKTWKHIGDSQ